MFNHNNIYKLKTNEDDYNFHKILGLLSLLNYIYQFTFLIVNGHSSYQVYPHTMTLYTILIHFLLSLSSLLFRLPNKRNKTNPMIWPEFRLHSIIFALRSLVAMVLFYFSPILDISTYKLLRCGTVLATIVMADLTTAHYKQKALIEKDDSTMRGMPMPDDWSQNTVNLLNLYYSVSQLTATLSVLVSESFEPLFLILFPIQISAFLMTCVRKGIINGKMWHILYSISLGSNYMYGLFLSLQYLNFVLWINLAILCVSILRLYFRMNKYVMWGSVCFLYLC